MEPVMPVVLKSGDTSSSRSVRILEVDEADNRLEALGYQQEMPRNRSMINVLLMAVAIAAIPYGQSTTLYYPLVGGGPVTVIWGWVLMTVITECVAVSLAEIVSRFPVSGGAYYWAYMVSGPEHALLASWICGWVSLVGNWTVTLAVNFGTAQLILAAVNIYKEDFVATAWQTVLTFWALTIFCTLISTFGGKHLIHLDTFCIFWTIGGLIAILATLLARHNVGFRSASWVFSEFSTTSGWPTGWSFFVGLLQGAYTLSSTGMVASMCEEVKDPETQVPKAIILNIALSGCTGLLFLLPLMFTMPDIETVLASPTGQPVPAIFKLVTGNNASAFGLFVIILVIGVFSGIGCTTAASRCTWAFARDGAIPGSGLWKKVHNGLEVPLNAVLLSTAVQCLLGILYFGSTAAFNAFSGVAVICLGVSYMIPILISLCRGRKAIANAKFNVGRFGIFCNIVSVVWFAFSIPLFCFPAAIPVTKESMNYASVVFVGFIAISAGWYVVWGRHHYTGPPTSRIHEGQIIPSAPALEQAAKETVPKRPEA